MGADDNFMDFSSRHIYSACDDDPNPLNDMNDEDEDAWISNYSESVLNPI